MPITLSTLFTTPQDIWDLLSVEGVDLREDDHNLATGQLIVVSADALEGATSLTVNSIPVALLRGAQLTFDCAGMEAPVTVYLSSAAVLGSTSLSVVALSDNIPANAQARDSGVNAATGARLLVGARKGTSKVKLYCNQRYDDVQLARSGSVLDWATVIAAKFLCTRRSQSCPKSIKADYEETIEELKAVYNGQLSIEDIGTRGADWPSVTNVIVNPAYDGMRARVQPNISDQVPVSHYQYIDWNSASSLWL